jgi:hypothetical protein
MKVIIAGSRDLEITIEELENIINNTGVDISLLLNGKCPTGIDKIAYKWAEKNIIPIEEYPAQWDTHGKSAGPKRNKMMAENAECLIAIYRENSLTPGTKNMIAEATKFKLKIFQHLIK